MRWIAGTLAALAVFAAGYALGRMASDGERKAERPSSDQRLLASQTDSQSSEFQSALRSALAHPILLERTRRSAELLSQLTAANAEEAMAVYRSENASQPLVDLLVDAWVQVDGQGAFDHVQQGAEFRQQQTIPNLLEGWARLEPQAALGAYLTLENPDAPKLGPGARRGNSLQAGLVKGWARSGDPGLTDFFFTQTGGSKLQTLAVFYLHERASQNGFDATVKFADELATDDETDNSFKRMMLSASGEALGRLDPHRASKWADTYAGDHLALSTQKGVASEWLAVEPEAAMQWLANLPEDDVRDKLVDRTYALWLMRHREDALKWAKQIAPSVALEPAIAQYVTELAKTDPELALHRAEGITNSKRRLNSLVNLGRAWYEIAPGPATAWLDQSELDDEQRAQVVKPSQVGRRGKRRDRDNAEDKSGKGHDLSGLGRF